MSKLEFETPTLANRLVVVENEALVNEVKSSLNELSDAIEKIKENKKEADKTNKVVPIAQEGEGG